MIRPLLSCLTVVLSGAASKAGVRVAIHNRRCVRWNPVCAAHSYQAFVLLSRERIFPLSLLSYHASNGVQYSIKVKIVLDCMGLPRIVGTAS